MAAGGGLSEVERKALEALDLDGLVSFLRELIAIPSLDGRETPAQVRVAAWLAANGLASDVWSIDLQELARRPDWSFEVERSEALGVVGSVGEAAAGGCGRNLLFNGHIDVVPAGDEAAWTTPPWQAALRNGRLYGRGAADMKGGLCCALYAAKAIRDSGVRLSGRLSVASVVGEEDGGTGTLATILRGHDADGAIVVEPTRLRVVTAQAGSLMFRLRVRGLAAHGCVREEGVSAVEKFVPLLAALRRLEAERCGAATEDQRAGDHTRSPVAGDPGSPLFARYRLPWPIEVGTVEAGDWPSSVPDTLVAEGRYGLAIGEDPAAARQEFESAVARAAAADPWLAAHPPQVEWWGGRFDPAVTDARDPLVAALVGAAAAVTGSATAVEGVTYGSDMRLLVNAGRMPTVLFGPGDVRVAHMPDEHVAVSDLETAARVLTLSAVRFCGAAL
jgi:acetylornithine deacetylase